MSRRVFFSSEITPAGDAFSKSNRPTLREAWLRLTDSHADEIVESFESLVVSQRLGVERALLALGYLVKAVRPLQVSVYGLRVLTKGIVDCCMENPTLILKYVTLTLAPGPKDVREHVRSLFERVLPAGGSSMLVVEASKNGREHVHGYVLAPNAFDPLAQWSELSSAVPTALTTKDVSGWKDRASNREWFETNVLRSLAYTLKEPPAAFRGDLRHDVLVCGAFSGLWDRVQRLEGLLPPGPASGPEQASLHFGNASLHERRSCPNCCRRIGTDERSDKKFCNARCRKAYSKKRAGLPRFDRASAGQRKK